MEVSEVYLYNNEWFDAFTSSNVERFRYDYPTRTLFVQFKGPKFSTYYYHDVPEQVMLDFMAAPSKGKFHHAAIKGKYRYDGPF